jgi:hypothetical protein
VPDINFKQFHNQDDVRPIKATSCDSFFQNYSTKIPKYENSQFQGKNSYFLLVLEQKYY